jgi:hypothetical protein
MMPRGLAIADFDPAQWAFLVFAILLCIWLIFRPWRRRRSDPLEKPMFKTSLAQQRALERQMSNLVVEMSEMARQITAQLDTRAAKLELLIKEADEKIARLGGAGSTSGNGAPVDANHGREIASVLEQVPPSTPAPADPRHAQVYRLADEGRSSQQIAQELNQPSGEIELILALRQRR